MPQIPAINDSYINMMDPDMRAVWDTMALLPPDMRLYGGTALMLYCGHRVSHDFDFASASSPVMLRDIASLQCFNLVTETVKLDGGDGMVDRVLRPLDPHQSGRLVKCSFMECGRYLPPPTMAPVMAPNGIAVAHPKDLAASKLLACRTRGGANDYKDIATLIARWPDWVREAAEHLDQSGQQLLQRTAYALAAPPAEIDAVLDQAVYRTLQSWAVTLMPGPKDNHEEPVREHATPAP